jgi:hypothetical protein
VTCIQDSSCGEKIKDEKKDIGGSWVSRLILYEERKYTIKGVLTLRHNKTYTKMKHGFEKQPPP